MIKKVFLIAILSCFFCSSVHADEPQEYVWQQETASCLVDENCTTPDNQNENRRKKCLQVSEKEEVTNNIIVVGDSCSAGEKTAEDIIKNPFNAVRLCKKIFCRD